MWNRNVFKHRLIAINRNFALPILLIKLYIFIEIIFFGQKITKYCYYFLVNRITGSKIQIFQFI